jgi:hypothetical protein
MRSSTLKIISYLIVCWETIKGIRGDRRSEDGTGERRSKGTTVNLRIELGFGTLHGRAGESVRDNGEANEEKELHGYFLRC